MNEKMLYKINIDEYTLMCLLSCFLVFFSDYLLRD